ncbi:chemotaxis protein CheW [Deltaproteobacteria bacterium Smac51]|nr:chemotaxis protein CheW [Deltaproteobacteria bacterium Smac51]
MIKSDDLKNGPPQEFVPVTLGGKYLTFSLGREEYGVNIFQIREIIGMRPVRPVPQTPHYVRGVISLRDKVIPVVELRLKLGMSEVEYNSYTSIVVTMENNEIGLGPVGVIVDDVSQVVNVRGTDVKPPPDLGGRPGEDFILGVFHQGETVRTIMDFYRVLAPDDFRAMASGFFPAG